MVAQLPDWRLSAIYLVALFFILIIRKYINHEKESGYTKVVIGVAILALTEILHSYHEAGYLKEVAFVSNPLFYDIITVIAVISGMIFLLSGISLWFPISRKSNSTTSERLKRLEFLKRVEQLVSIENRENTLFTTTLDQIVEVFGFKQGMFLKRNIDNNKLEILNINDKAGLNKLSDSIAYEFSDIGWKKYLSGAPSIASGMVRYIGSTQKYPTFMIPVEVNGKPRGFFSLFAHKGIQYEYEDEAILKIASDIIARKLELKTVHQELNCNRRRIGTIANLSNINNNRSAIKDSLKMMFNELNKHLSLTVLVVETFNDRLKEGHRISVGRTDHFLEEEIETTSLLKQPDSLDDYIIIRVIPPNFKIHESISRHKPVSMIQTYMCRGNESIVLSAISDKPIIEESNINFSLSIMKLMMPLLSNDKLEISQYHLRQNQRMNGLLEVSSVLKDFKSLANYASRMITDELSADYVRVSILDRKARFMESMALSVEGSAAGIMPERGTALLEMMPNITNIYKAGKSRIFNLKKYKLFDESEIRQIFVPPLEELMVVPLIFGSKVRGFIFVGNKQVSETNVLNHEQQNFVEAVGRTLELWTILTARSKQAKSLVSRPVTKQNKMEEKKHLRILPTRQVPTVSDRTNEIPYDRSKRKTLTSYLDNLERDDFSEYEIEMNSSSITY